MDRLLNFFREVTKPTFVFSCLLISMFLFGTCAVRDTVQEFEASEKKKEACSTHQSMVVYKEHVFWIEKPNSCNINGSVEEVETVSSDKCLPFSKDEVLFSQQ